MEDLQQQKDDVLAAISEGVLEPEAEYLPMVTMKEDEHGRMEILVDGQHFRTVKGDLIRGHSIRVLSRRLGMKSDAVELRPSDPSHRVGVLLPPHIALLPRKALWRKKGKRSMCLMVLSYRPLADVVEIVQFSWSDEDPLRTTSRVVTISSMVKLVKKGRLQTFQLEPGNHPPALLPELQRYGANPNTYSA